ncbi:MAG: hypothetical protein A2513_04415 [Sulfurimonas sp. RIFOXYD12_FULL_33_39]|uniref:hypothetical protein n=1 Tax=unclassified Sulfurimonas TaxID=2623549 RepID=UPI0008BC9660|nr:MULTISPECIES: hypothetical protein [unclassified Sulfurimonas]OHE09378.1 MAG: hypothetical protein A2513_04415 [Sulfurimonas sp. RIFOXYD12_FULL_33_39]OHE12840.1 MAG: hypothetical protein A2530_04390 [Sulfurimonas sp. RIFOXYD2_FULL_34_21]DAB27341.1 MAG TPA: hypothetical protein CFH78_08425 [Sulfurimonas sp. UBA10385]
MTKEKDEELEQLEEKNEVESTPPEEKNSDDDIADILTSKELERTVNKLIDEKLSLASDAEDVAEEIPLEDEEEDKKGFGIFPIIIFGVLALGAATLLLTQNRPQAVQNDITEQNHG